ncbi:unnamed protein product [Linum tenue]|uniref:Uncharacterized protein n=1 Tax=Linum tenue TaxID=586396 RepID=A0AAV0KS63_9ROSI|nr:unnamed protein product [Linum tenue]
MASLAAGYNGRMAPAPESAGNERGGGLTTAKAGEHLLFWSELRFTSHDLYTAILFLVYYYYENVLSC